MKKLLLIVILLFSIEITACSADINEPFESHWAYNEILELHNKELIADISDYNPNDNITRSEFLNLFLSTVISPDIPAVKGGIFNSGKEITRYDAVYIIVTALKLNDRLTDFRFSDNINKNSFIYAAYNAGIVTGYPDGAFKSSAKLTKAEGAVILKRISDKIENEINLETERKFLIDPNNIPHDLSEADKYEIIQTYISISPEIRVRQLNGYDYWFALKMPKDNIGLSRQELEFPIIKEEYEYLFDKKEVESVLKTRYQFTEDDYMVAVDVYDGNLKGLAVSEIEFESVEESEKFIPFDWYLKDITSDKRYKNANLALDGMPIN